MVSILADLYPRAFPGGAIRHDAAKSVMIRTSGYAMLPIIPQDTKTHPDDFSIICQEIDT
jgi:hypothetical protein